MGKKRLVGYSPKGHKESDMTEFIQQWWNESKLSLPPLSRSKWFFHFLRMTFIFHLLSFVYLRKTFLWADKCESWIHDLVLLLIRTIKPLTAMGSCVLTPHLFFVMAMDLDVERTISDTCCLKFKIHCHDDVFLNLPFYIF